MDQTTVTDRTTTVSDPAFAPAAAHAAALWSGLLMLLLLVLAVLVIRQRGRHKVLLGDNGVPELVRAGRAFGNATEYVPAGMAAMAVLAVVGSAAWVVHLVGGALFVGRVAHGYGLSRDSGTSPGRMVGMILTFAAFLVAGVALLLHAM